MVNFGIESIGGAAGAASPLGGPDRSQDGGSEGFGDLLSSLGEVQGQADAAITDLAVGGDRELYDVVLAVEMESIAFELAVQIRNRLVDAYQEIFRMSV